MSTEHEQPPALAPTPILPIVQKVIDGGTLSKDEVYVLCRTVFIPAINKSARSGWLQRTFGEQVSEHTYKDFWNDNLSMVAVAHLWACFTKEVPATGKTTWINVMESAQREGTTAESRESKLVRNLRASARNEIHAHTSENSSLTGKSPTTSVYKQVSEILSPAAGKFVKIEHTDGETYFAPIETPNLPPNSKLSPEAIVPEALYQRLPKPREIKNLFAEVFSKYHSALTKDQLQEIVCRTFDVRSETRVELPGSDEGLTEDGASSFAAPHVEERQEALETPAKIPHSLGWADLAVKLIEMVAKKDQCAVWPPNKSAKKGLRGKLLIKFEIWHGLPIEENATSQYGNSFSVEAYSKWAKIPYKKVNDHKTRLLQPVLKSFAEDNDLVPSRASQAQGKPKGKAKKNKSTQSINQELLEALQPVFAVLRRHFQKEKPEIIDDLGLYMGEEISEIARVRMSHE